VFFFFFFIGKKIYIKFGLKLDQALKTRMILLMFGIIETVSDITTSLASLDSHYTPK